ncbi:MAG: uroporphyrinogen decarboxylase family protein [Atribacterota bacterium]
MNPRERVTAALWRKQPDKTPKYAEFTPLVGKALRERTGVEDLPAYFQIESRSVLYPFYRTAGKGELKEYYSEEMFRQGDHGASFDEWGVLHLPGSLYHFTKMVHPLESVESVEGVQTYPFPLPASTSQKEDLKKMVDELHRQELFVMGFAVQIFEPAWYLRGMENFLVDMIQNPRYAEALLDAVTRVGCTMARDFADAGVDLLVTGDDVAMQQSMILSPNVWRSWLKPRLAQVIRAARAVNPEIFLYYHSDGKVDPIIPELIEVGVEVLNPVQPECLDPAKVKRKWGDVLSFWGTMGTQTTFPFGSPEEVRQTVRQRVEEVGKGGGLVLAPTHVIEPDVPLENIIAFFEEVNS